MQVQASGGAYHAGRNVDQTLADGRGRRLGQSVAGDARGGVGQVERDGGRQGPGGVRGEHPGGQVGQGPVLQVGDDLFDDRVVAVVGLVVKHRLGRVGEDRV